MKFKRNLLLGLSAFTYLAGGLQSAMADDTEIYVTRDLPADQRIRPNLMFLIDTSGSMLSSVPGTNCKTLNYNGTNTVPENWCTNTNRTKGTKTRIQVVKEVVNSLVDELAASNDVNIGLARFDSSSNGGFVNIPMQRAGDVSTAFKTALSSYYADGGTPLLESYYETYLYMSGGTPSWGLNSKGYIENRTDSKLVSPWKSDSGSLTGSKYKSPIQYSCQKSNIIVLTDGLPSNDVGSNSTVQSLVSSVNQTYKSCNRNYPTDDNGTTSGCWMPGLAEYMANQDVSSSQTGKQTINTYTIGFGNISDTRLLEDSASLGGGRFFTTSNTSELAEALRSIAVDILAENTTFATPSVSVSAYNNLGYRNDLYYALFRPAAGARWFGNIKKYKLGKDTVGNSIVMDSNGRNAVDLTTGFFNGTSQSYWSTVTDGKDVKLGGAAGRLTNPSGRNIYTYVGDERTPGLSGSVALSALATSNTGITKPLLGLATGASDQSRLDTINWGIGINPSDGTARLAIADILHNEPRLVAYVTDENLQRVVNSQATPPTATSTERLVLFYGTNEGFINAVDPATGTEIFSFIPKELLPNLNFYLNDPKGTANKRYGMDGQMEMSVTYGALSTNQARTVTQATLYAGMRRGGRNYYALDVSPSSTSGPVSITPKLKWVIKGGTSTGFEKLGQTWSTPKQAKVKFNGSNKNVLFFTGGYDTNQDTESPNTPTNDTVGNALYMVDADTGALLWHAGVTTETSANLKIATLTNSIPADPTLVDSTGDGLIDTIFMADTRGQVFRIDLNTGNAGASNFATGGRIAALGGATAAENRRFYNAPDVSLIRERGGKTYFTIALGTGYREHPLNEDTVDRFYVLRDNNVYAAPSSYTTLTESSLVDVTSVNLTSQQAQQIKQSIDTKLGQIAQLNQATSTADTNFDSYKSSIGYTQKYNQLTQANSDATQRQAQIDAIYKENPFLDEHAPESALQSAQQNQLLSLQNALKQLYAFSPDAAQALGQQMAGVMIVQMTLENSATTLATKEQAVLSAKASGASDDTLNALRADLEQARAAYQASAAYTQRASLNGVDLSGALNSLNQAIRANDLAAANSAVQSIASQLALTDVPSTVDVAMLNGRKEAEKASDLQSQASSQNSLLQLSNDLETQRVALASQAATLQTELQTLSNTAYDTSSNLLTSAELQDARSQDSTPPLSAFEAYDYLRNKARSSALAQIPVLRGEINSLYQQLTPGDSYSVNSDLLNASSGWFVRFPQGEKVLSSSISYQGAVLFTTFSPNGQTVTTCGPDVGRGRMYAMNLVDASAVYTKDVAGVETPSRSFDLVRGGIPPTPAVILGDDKTTVLVGSEKPSGDGNGGDLKCTFTSSGLCKTDVAVRSTYWREN
ncbi:PilC/PilY family type IV pilus protein [Pseudomonas sp. PDM20]|uniref:PilC/PilY family type IV pilus protein n=1 Tax=Pseudomonas sp. PDM20 TaxID=2769254 RepID=UPI00177C0CE3|nr:PilC/PilY family type IV pilus protein [Pseudomonas sp. PDM20]MBD9682594.1 pilus assembly protein PilY [Pseudomonas sp. PDM20]